MKKLAIIVCAFAFAFSIVAQAADSSATTSVKETSATQATQPAAAMSQDNRPAVPRSVSTIANPELRKAVSDHSPNYDDLGRGSQVFTYIHVYKSMNDGLMPAVASDDLDLIYRIEPVQSTMSNDEVRHYDLTPSMLIETTTVPTRTDWSDNYERYMSDHDLKNSSSDESK